MLEVLNLTKKRVCLRNLKKVADGFLEKYKIKNAEISLVLIGDSRSRSLNKKYRNRDHITDVLSFSNKNFNSTGDNFLGEIFINLAELSHLEKYQEMFLELEGFKEFELIKLLSLSRSAQERYLLNFVFVHGLLHLIGFNDKKEVDRKKMLRLGARFLKCYN